MALENYMSHLGIDTKQIVDRYSEYPGTVHDHQVYYAYEPSGSTHEHGGHSASNKHNYGSGLKSNASMSALTLLAFLFFLHILQQCIKDHMDDMSASSPVMVMSAGREGEENLSKVEINKIDKTGLTNSPTGPNVSVKTAEDAGFINNEEEKEKLTRIDLLSQTKNVYKRYEDLFQNDNSGIPGYINAMEEYE